MENQQSDVGQIQNQPLENFTPSPVEIPPRPNKKLVIILIAIAVAVLLIVAICGGVYYYIIHKNAGITGNDSDEHGCKGSAGYSWCAEKNECLRVWEEPCTASKDETVGWQTYRNEEYGFEVKLPNISVNYYSAADLKDIDKDAIFEMGLARHESGPIEYSLIVYGESLDVVLQKLADRQGLIIDKTVLGGVEAKRATYKATYFGINSTSPVTNVATVAEHSGKVYEIWLLDKDTDKEFGYYEQILSTFKFIN